MLGPPAQGIVGRDDPMDAVRGQEAVVNPLPQAVGVDRVAEIGVGVGVRVAFRRCGQAKLIRGLEVFEDLPPTALVPGTTPMAFVNDNQVEEVRRVFAVKAGPVVILRNGLIDGEVDFPALADLPARDFPAGIAKGGEGLVLGIVNQDVAVGQIENLGATVFAGAIPEGIPQFPANLESRPGSCRCRSPSSAGFVELPSRLLPRPG